MRRRRTDGRACPTPRPARAGTATYVGLLLLASPACGGGAAGRPGPLPPPRAAQPPAGSAAPSRTGIPGAAPGGPTEVASSPAGPGARSPGAAAAPPLPAGKGLLLAEDPPHDVAQRFPPARSCRAHAVPGGVLPNTNCTPGVTDPHITQANLARTVCRPGGYTGSVRPPASVTGREKTRALAAYGEFGPRGDYELDHLVPLALGGSPNSARNLWPEPGSSPNPKDTLEAALHNLVCARRLTLIAGQQAIATNWVTAYRATLGRDPT